jgi:hypothetical protein
MSTYYYPESSQTILPGNGSIDWFFASKPMKVLRVFLENMIDCSIINVQSIYCNSLFATIYSPDLENLETTQYLYEKLDFVKLCGHVFKMINNHESKSYFMDLIFKEESLRSLKSSCNEMKHTELKAAYLEKLQKFCT